MDPKLLGLLFPHATRDRLAALIRQPYGNFSYRTVTVAVEGTRIVGAVCHFVMDQIPTFDYIRGYIGCSKRSAYWYAPYAIGS